MKNASVRLLLLLSCPFIGFSVYGANGFGWSAQIPWDAVTPVRVQEGKGITEATGLTGFQIAPNPAGAGKVVCFQVEGAMRTGETAILRIFSLDGKLVKTFRLGAAARKAAWNTGSGAVASGAYVARLKCGRAFFEQKFTVMK
jgi:hypothetical protein